jgi:hypothetical protein
VSSASLRRHRLSSTALSARRKINPGPIDPRTARSSGLMSVPLCHPHHLSGPKRFPEHRRGGSRRRGSAPELRPARRSRTRPSQETRLRARFCPKPNPDRLARCPRRRRGIRGSP